MKLKWYSIGYFLFFSLKIFSQPDTVSFLNSQTRNYDQHHIKLTVAFDFNEEKVIGECDFSFSPLVDNFRELVLHAKTMKVGSVKVSNKELQFRQNDMHLFIEMDKDYSKEDSVTVSIDYETYPARGMYFFKPTKEIPEMPYQIWTQGEGEYNRFWYPSYDLPDDKLTSEIFVIVPSNLIAISNGILEGVEENGKNKVFHWKMDKPYSTYLTSIIVGDYVTVKEKVKGIVLEYNIPPDWVDKRDYFFGRTPRMLNFFSDYICPYPYERYAQTPVQDFEWGGMENITATTLNRRIFHDKNAEPNYTADDLIVHEFVHQWFGDYLTCKTFQHIWLNEGFATYFTDLWYEDEFGKDDFLYQRYLANKLYFEDELKAEPVDTIQLKEEFIPVELSGDKAYERGAAILNMLRFVLGDETFEKALKHYVGKHKYQGVTTEDFRISLEESSGRNLKEFFKQWIYQAGFPEFKVDYSWNESSKELKLNVKQTQQLFPAVGIFEIPVLVEIVAGKQLIRERINIAGKENSFTFTINQKPDLVRFNKYEWILCKVDFEKSFDELVYQLQYDDDVVGRLDAAKQLSKFGEKSVDVLNRAILTERYYGVRLSVVESLKEIGGDKVLEPLIKACDDADARVREAAVKTLSVFSYGKVEDILFDKLKNDDNYYVKGAALYSIGAIKHPKALQILTDALKMDSHMNIIRRGTFEGFKALGNPSILPLVKEYTKYKYSYGGMHLLDTTALDCAKSFAETNYGEVIDVISSALSNPYFRTRIHAAKLLAELGAKDKLPDIIKFYEEDRRLVVKNELKIAIDKLLSQNK